MATIPWPQQQKRQSRVGLYRLPLLAAGLALLLAALWAGLLRLGWSWPTPLPTLPMAHGPLMINGFLGALIGLERAIALQKRWAYLAPLLTLLGAFALLTGGGATGLWLIVAGGLVLLAIMAQIFAIHPSLDAGVIALGVILWLVGNFLWGSGLLIGQVVFWWAGFLILTIAGERLELSRFLRLSTRAILLFSGTVALFVGGLLLSLLWFVAGVRLAGVGMIALAAWLLFYDIARRRIKAGGQARFMALALLSGYLWLGIGGGLAIVYGGYLAGPYYDALLHAVFLGFVFTMIFAHAPIVFPAVLQRPLRYSPRFYSHLLLLHVTLVLRIAGDLLLWQPGRLWGGLLNALVLLLFLANTITAMRAAAVAPEEQS
ncbi:MAG: hypothetical protein DYG89_26935 [Caldilinea sp. CFX5]|nr:hypothetical protein [Caldilinea sp. CFX5]